MARGWLAGQGLAGWMARGSRRAAHPRTMMIFCSYACRLGLFRFMNRPSEKNTGSRRRLARSRRVMRTGKSTQLRRTTPRHQAGKRYAFQFQGSARVRGGEVARGERQRQPHC